MSPFVRNCEFSTLIALRNENHTKLRQDEARSVLNDSMSDDNERNPMITFDRQQVIHKGKSELQQLLPALHCFTPICL